MTVTTFFRPESDEGDGNDFEDDVAISSVDTDDKSPTHNPGMISAQVGGCMNDLNVIRMMPYATQMVPPMSLPLSTSDLWLYYAAAVGCRCRRHRHSSSSSSCSITRLSRHRRRRFMFMVWVAFVWWTGIAPKRPKTKRFARAPTSTSRREGEY